MFVRKRRWSGPFRSGKFGGAAGDGDLLLSLNEIPNYRLGGPFGDMDMGSFLDLDAAKQNRFRPAFTDDFLQNAGYTLEHARRIQRYLDTQDPNALSI